MKIFAVVILAFFGITGILPIFAEDIAPVPSCSTGIFVTNNVQCHTRNSPPCTIPSFQKNGLCVVEKIDICEEGNILKDGSCIPNIGNFRVDAPGFTKQHLLTGKPMTDPNPENFRESGDFVGMLYAYSGLGLVGMIIGFYVIKKVKTKKETSNPNTRSDKKKKWKKR